MASFAILSEISSSIHYSLIHFHSMLKDNQSIKYIFGIKKNFKIITSRITLQSARVPNPPPFIIRRVIWGNLPKSLSLTFVF